MAQGELVSVDPCPLLLPPVSFKEEIEGILDRLEQERLAIRYKVRQASSKSLKECLNDHPLGLHFSCHGFANARLGKLVAPAFWALNKNKGDVLVFEQPNGASEYYFEA